MGVCPGCFCCKQEPGNSDAVGTYWKTELAQSPNRWLQCTWLWQGSPDLQWTGFRFSWADLMWTGMLKYFCKILINSSLQYNKWLVSAFCDPFCCAELLLQCLVPPFVEQKILRFWKKCLLSSVQSKYRFFLSMNFSHVEKLFKVC